MNAIASSISRSDKAGNRHWTVANDLMLLGYGALLIVAFLGYNVKLLPTFMQQFWMLTVLLTTHNLVEFYLIFRKTTKHFWLKPVILGSIVLFFLQHGALTNYLYRGLDGEFHQPYNDYLIEEPVWLARTMALVLACSVLYWFGYKLFLGVRLAKSYLTIFGPFWHFSLSRYKLLMGWLFGCTIMLLLNYYGAIGHRFGHVIQEAGGIPPIIYRMKIFENLSLLFVACFLFLAIQQKRNMFYWVIFFIGIIFEIVLSLTSGTRSGILFIFSAIFLVDYFHRGHLRWIWIIGGAIILVFAMTILQGFKDFGLREAREAAQIKDPIAYIQSANNYRSQLNKSGNTSKAAKHSLFLTSVGRFNYVNEATQVMRHKQVNGLDSNDPDFLGPFLTFPLFAVIPRYWVLGKPAEAYGNWATHLLIGTRKYDMAVSPVGYAYLAGGAALVMVVFFILGILMQWLEYLFRHIQGVIGFILFLALLKILVQFDTIVWANYLNLIRYSILLPPLLWLLLRKWPMTKPL